MPTLKIETIRPSLESKFWMEEVMMKIPPIRTGDQDDLENYFASMGLGFVTSYYDESITDSEIQTRESEIKENIKSIFFLPRDQWSYNFVPEVDTAPADLIQFLGWGFHHQPPYNPFALTWTFYMVFDTMEHLQQFRSRPVVIDGYTNMILPAVANANNTIKLYVDGVED